MKKGDKAAIVCCSNGLNAADSESTERLQHTLRQLGLVPVASDFLYAGESVFSGTAKQRADAVMNFFRDKEVKAIFDISGGDIANEILPCLDFGEIADSKAVFCGYSDLTTVMNAIYTKTGKQSVWYQAKNLVSRDAPRQTAFFSASALEGKPDLFEISSEFVQGTSLRGVVVGGNVRCLLKLAGTPYWPDMKGNILFMEARSGSSAQMVAYLNQLKQMGVFEAIQGILLGTFLQMEKEQKEGQGGWSMAELVKRYAGTIIPIVRTSEVGHRSDSKALILGKEYIFEKEKRKCRFM